MILRSFIEETEEVNFFLEQNQNIFIFSAYACTSSCKLVVASKRALISSVYKIVINVDSVLHDDKQREILNLRYSIDIAYPKSMQDAITYEPSKLSRSLS